MRWGQRGSVTEELEDEGVFAGDTVGKLASWRKSMSSCSAVRTSQAYPGQGQPSAGEHEVTGRTRVWCKMPESRRAGL